MGLFSRNGRISEGWSFDAKGKLVCPVTVAPLGGAMRVLIGTKDGRVVCLDSAGKPQWVFTTGEQLSATESYFVDEGRVHAIDAPPVVADVDGDGKEEVIVGSELGVLYCLSAQGKLKWKHDCKGPIRNAALVEDMNTDGMPEVLVGVGEKLVVLSGRGDVMFEYITQAPVESVPGVLKGEKPLIVFGNSAGDLLAITPAQERAWQLQLGDKITAAPAILPSREERRLVIGTHGGAMCCVSEHGEMVWQYRTQGSIYGAAAIHDLDDDGVPEVIFGSCDNSVYAITADGKRLWSYETDFWVTGTPLVCDVDGDGRLEVVAGSFDHSVYVLDARGEYLMDYVPGIAGIVHQAGHYSSLLTSEPGEQAGKKLYQYRLPDLIVGCTLLEEGGKLRLVAATKGGRITLLQHSR